MDILLYVDSSSPIKKTIRNIYLSFSIYLIYGFLIVITIFSIVLMLASNSYHGNPYADQGWFIAIELTICVIVLLDLSFRIYLISPRIFVRSILNILDIIFTISSIVEIILALVDRYAEKIGTIIALTILITRNIFMIIRIFILMKRSITLRKELAKPIQSPSLSIPDSLETIPKPTKPQKKAGHRPRLFTLGEEDEVFEDSLGQKPSVWQGRVKQSSEE